MGGGVWGLSTGVIQPPTMGSADETNQGAHRAPEQILCFRYHSAREIAQLGSDADEVLGLGGRAEPAIGIHTCPQCGTRRLADAYPDHAPPYHLCADGFP